ncbi:serine/threonine-protein kinase [Tahibacter amnicola]|uniref:Protein kinase n=1 Tax=Tahibacter amnicola TaxID=2976241 RepID=A0ABY6BCD0_9GAMM|nr:serine/threonine-protein kinase [Tahibacter amnicola]UXI67207.1 protein kinase [Tahibacter amnicola]
MIDIPGYRVLRPLGRGGMATVYLAVQESVDREVALKVMSPTLMADPTFGERFLREARIAAKLHHPNVVGIHDVGRSGDCFYIAMEYIPGGTILDDEGRAREVPFALRAVREIARALHYANSKGFVHRDVKPDNILIREDGSFALTDFGIARANDSATRMTRTGAVVGTPHYMSPEQARGRSLDGRSDLYSLGIVLYELLVGRVPFHAEDSLAVGIMHITEPVPQLPSEFKALQPVLDRLLAKEPDDRYQDGVAVATAIEGIERQIARGELRDLVRPRSASPRGGTERASPSARMGAEPRRRAEPSLGRMDDIVAAAERPLRATDARRPPDRDRVRRPGGSRAAWIFTGAFAFLVVMGGFVLWRNQDKLRALLPRTELNDLLARGDAASKAGRLVGTAGDSARELFEAARAIDPDNEIARSGLRRVGEALIVQAEQAREKNDYATAHSRLADARAVLGGGPAVDQAEQALKKAESEETQVIELFDRAEKALAAGLILGTDGAVMLYERMLQADAQNAPALAGLRKAGAALAAQARELLSQGRLDEAATRIDDIARALPNDPSVPNLRADLQNARAAAGAALDAQVKRAQDLLRAGKVSGSGDDNALAQFQAVLARDPNNSKARTGLGQVAQALMVQANAALESSNANLAERLIRQAEGIAPNLAELSAARSRLRDLREEVEIAASRPVLTPDQVQKVATLLASAEKAAAAGNLMVPPGTSAYDKYRAALAIDGNNAQAMTGLQSLPQRARDEFNVAVGEQKLDRAKDMIETLAQLSPGDAGLPFLRSRLAEAWLDEADRRVGENRAQDARRAIDAARGLSPSNPRLTVLEQKLRALGSSTTTAAGDGSGS